MHVICKISKRNTLKGKGAEKLFPKAVMYNTLDNNSIVDAMERNCGVKPGETQKVVAGMQQTLYEMLGNGHRVKINGLGTFSIGVKGGVIQREDGRMALKDTYINKVVFTPDANLMHSLRSVPVVLRSQQVDENGVLTEDVALDVAIRVLDNKGAILCQDFASSTGVSDTYARQWLEKLVDNGLLRRVGSKNRYVYLAA